jgi:hypothetical protein
MARPIRQLNAKTQEALRQRIQSAQLIKSVQKLALSDLSSLDEGSARAVSVKLEAAKFLLTRAISPPVPKDDDGKTATGPVLITWGT